MAEIKKRGKKGEVENIVTALLHSEIPEIQTIINELSGCTKQLEEHSQKLQSYALKIQELAKEEEAEMPMEAELLKRLESLERALAEVREKTAVLPSKLKSVVKIQETLEEAKETKEVRKEVPPLPGRWITYTTPEGFTVRKRIY